MGAIKIPAWPKGVAGNVWANKLADASVYAVESNALNYDTGTSALIFALPDDVIVLGVGIEVVTAFATVEGNTRVDVTDSASNILARFGYNVLDAAGFYQYPGAFRRYTKSTGAGSPSKAIEVDVVNASTATAGIFRVWLNIKPNRNSLRTDFVGSY